MVPIYQGKGDILDLGCILLLLLPWLVPSSGVFFFVIRHSFTIEDLVSAPNLKLGCAVILRGCASDYINCARCLVQVKDYIHFGDRLDVVDRCENSHWERALKASTVTASCT